jgi:hypothetical protein
MLYLSPLQTLRLFTYIVVCVIVGLVFLATVYAVRWSRVLLARRGWAFVMSGISCHLVTIVATIVSFSLEGYKNVIEFVSATFWVAGCIVLFIGVRSIYNAMRSGGG